jgi:hypothetical protein
LKGQKDKELSKVKKKQSEKLNQTPAKSARQGNLEPRQRTIEILPLCIGDFPVLHFCRVRFYISFWSTYVHPSTNKTNHHNIAETLLKVTMTAPEALGNISHSNYFHNNFQYCIPYILYILLEHLCPPWFLLGFV